MASSYIKGTCAHIASARDEVIDEHCALLAQLSRHLLVHGADVWAREAAGAVLQFFDGAGAHPPTDIWRLLRAKLVLVQDGEKEWIRKTEVHRFLARCTELRIDEAGCAPMRAA